MTSDRAAAEQVLHEVHGRAPGWRLGSPFRGGLQSGAWSVRHDDGRTAVLKLTADAGWARQVTAAAGPVAAVRRAGYPTPAWSEVGTTTTGTAYVLQEFCPGRTIELVDERTAAAIVDVVESQAGLDPDPGRSWTDFALEQLGDGWERLRSTAREQGADRRLLEVCDRLADGAGSVAWPRTDMVHGDLRPANLLFQDGVVRGVVDIEAIGSGTRVFDFATLLSHARITPAAVERIVTAGARAAEPVVLRACVAVVLLDLVRFTGERLGPTPRDRGSQIRALTERAETIERLTP
ncbi:aminoglycoside phosphotransferase family protein [Curtobacterium sp. PhB136]|uniref:phosphotransferase n=1 Tax=Curtobacterium sp. PhB136 TaxID=2485181 RepID=UPI0010EF1BDB|nr:aminoglycoside phosphotransferase family protein [Curtobacterium sp. PhB136]TCK61282.1 aminoglycoside phosphotransferase (APT) family kinase protein [Curtobacterium sp. PhB136]